MKAFTILWSRYGPHLWMHSLRKVLDPWKRLPSKSWFDFWKEPEIARSQVEWVWWMFHQMDTIVIKVRLCDMSFLRSCIVVMELDSRPTLSPCRWLNMQKNFWQNWSCVICGSDCSFVGLCRQRQAPEYWRKWWTFSFLNGNLFSGPPGVVHLRPATPC